MDAYAEDCRIFRDAVNKVAILSTKLSNAQIENTLHPSPETTLLINQLTRARWQFAASAARLQRHYGFQARFLHNIPGPPGMGDIPVFNTF